MKKDNKDFNPEVNDYVENKALELLTDCFQNEYGCERNNINRKTDLDLSVWDAEKMLKIDVQYSFGFGTYKSINVDLVSTGRRKPEFMKSTVKELNDKINKSKTPYKTLESITNIKTKGKYFNYPDLLGVFYFMYSGYSPNHPLTVDWMESHPASYFTFVPTNLIKQMLARDASQFTYYINDKEKNNLGDTWDSAFMSIAFEKLDVPIFTFDTLGEFHDEFPDFFRECFDNFR